MQNVAAQLAEVGIDKLQLDEKIKAKQAQFHYLLTEEAATRIIAKEKGIKFIDAPKEETSLSSIKQGDRVTVTFRIESFNEPKQFIHQERKGTLLVLTLKNVEKTAALLVWNNDAKNILKSNLTVNDCVLVSDAVVKNISPLELNVDILTKIDPVEDAPNIKKREAKQLDFEALKPSESLVSLNCFVTSIGKIKTFPRDKTQGKLCRALLTNGNASVPLVCWGEYAEMLSNVEENSQITLTDAKIKVNKLNNLAEVHSTQFTRIVIQPNRLTTTIKPEQISQLKREGETTYISGIITVLDSIKIVKLCEKCFSTCKTTTCVCGGNASEVIILEATIKDETAAIQCTFFDKRALQLLEMKSISPDIAETVLGLKKSQLQNKQVTLKIITKFDKYLNALTANCREIL